MLVVGVGNLHRADDGVGPLVAQIVRERRIAEVATVAEPLDLIEVVAGHQCVVIVDACSATTTLGQDWPLGSNGARTFFCMRGGPPKGHRSGTRGRKVVTASLHGFELLDVLDLAAALGVLPADTLVLLVKGERFGLGEPMTDAVRRSALDAADWIVEYEAAIVGEP